MNYTISMTDILLAVSVGCNLWFLFLLLYERIMDTRIVRFFKGIVGLWRSLDGNEAKRIAAHEEVPAEKADIIGKSRFRMASTRTTAAIPTQEAATIEKALSCRRKRLLLTTENGKRIPPGTSPGGKLDETFTSIPPEELGYGDDEPEEDASDTPRASGSSFDEIDDACKTAKTRTRHRRNVKRRLRCSPTWRARSCTRNDGRLFGDRHPHQGAYRDSAEEI